jgi:mono/diheme cytochrome c family protein
MKFIAGVVVGILIVVAAGAFMVYGGRTSIAATTPPDLLDKMAPVARDRAIARQAPALSIPDDPARAARGREHYGENCLPCHGAPGVKAMEMAEGMNPKPPELDGPHTRGLSDGQLFWIVKNGIRASGMPAFGVNHQDPEIQDIVAFVRHLPALTPAEKQELGEALPREHHHEGGGHEEAEGHAEAPGHEHAPGGPPHHH